MSSVPSGDQRARSGPPTFVTSSRGGGGHDLRMIGQAQVVVAGEIDERAAVHIDVRRVDATADAARAAQTTSIELRQLVVDPVERVALSRRAKWFCHVVNRNRCRARVRGLEQATGFRRQTSGFRRQASGFTAHDNHQPLL